VLGSGEIDMRRTFGLVLSFALAACSAQSPQPDGAEETETPGGMPDVALTAAPGVAFNYRYAFDLAEDRIAAVQEQHAQACEKLGVARCRITGLRYQVFGDGAIRGLLALKLAPPLARRYGKDGLRIVEAADGRLIDAEISGTDVAPAISTARREKTEADAALKRIASRLARPGLPEGDRNALEAEAERLRGTAGSAADTAASAAEALAQTPVVFQYRSGSRTDLSAAIASIGENLRSSLAGIILILSVLLPWLIAAGLIAAVARWVRKRWFAPTID
jgi:hypothetical protein